MVDKKRQSWSNSVNIPISMLRIDGGTQNRFQLNEETVSEYMDALTEGANFPPVTVFFDGSNYWLADGFHRYHAHRKIGALNVEGDIRNGTCRDAILHSVGVNASHGLRRTNSDKRKAVETLLNDSEWAKWSDRQISEACSVSHPFVAAIRKPEVAERQQLNRDKSVAQRLQVESDSTPRETPKATNTEQTPVISDDMVLYPKEEFEENIRLLEETRKDNESMVKIFEANDQLDSAVKEVRRLNALVTVLEERNRGMQNEANEAKRLARSWKNRCEKLEREFKEAGLVDL
jgi:hypothetical protein